MKPISAAILHSINALLVLVAATILLITNHIDASTGTALIAAAGGLSLGVGAVSIGASSNQPTPLASVTQIGSSAAPTS